MKKVIFVTVILLAVMSFSVFAEAGQLLVDLGGGIWVHDYSGGRSFREGEEFGDAAGLRLGFMGGVSYAMTDMFSLGAELGLSIFPLPTPVVELLFLDVPLVAHFRADLESLGIDAAVMAMGGIMLNTYTIKTIATEEEDAFAKWSWYVAARVNVTNFFAELGYVIPFDPANDFAPRLRFGIGMYLWGPIE